MKNNVAIVGSSPIMIILAYELLNKGQNVRILDFRSEIGGAWSYINFRNAVISTQTNVIVPDNDFEERNIPKLNEYLVETFDVKITENNDSFQPLGYLAKKNYDYDLRNIYKLIRDNVIPRDNVFVNQLVLKKNKVEINKEYEFDKVYIPTYCGISEIISNGQAIDVNSNVIISEHALLIAEKLNVDRFAYTENFDDNFDRVQIKRVDDIDVFTGRIRKNKKGGTVKDLIRASSLVDDNEIIKLEKFKYRNYFRNFDQRKKLRDCTTGSNVIYINTALFVEAFFELNNKINMVKL